MKCAHCTHFDTATHPGHFKVGFGHCPPLGQGAFVSVSRDMDCKHWKQAAQDVIEARRLQWRSATSQRGMADTKEQ